MRSSTHTHRVAAALVAALVLAASSVAVTSPAGARVTAQARGFDGTTITVGGLGNMATVGAAQVGAKARIERFNKTHEIKGVKIDYVGFEDDKGDPATALTQARKLVTQDRVFAIVGDSSSYNPSEFLTQQKVPFFGWGYEKAYCAPKPTTSLWGFGYATTREEAPDRGDDRERHRHRREHRAPERHCVHRRGVRRRVLEVDRAGNPGR